MSCRACDIEAELGRLKVEDLQALAAGLKPKERILSYAYVCIATMLCGTHSYRASAEVMNRILHRASEEGIKPRTLADFVDGYGRKISGCIKAMADGILKEARFDSETLKPADGTAIPENVLKPAEPANDGSCAKLGRAIMDAVEEINSSREGDECVKRQDLVAAVEASESCCCYISIDDIGVKHQKDTRKDGGSKDGRYVENTVIHVQADGQGYYITAIGMKNAFSILLAFLLSNRLLDNRRLVFLADGARNILSCIESSFAFCEHSVILDWYHLKKKCKELISSSLKGDKEEKKKITRTLLRMLWVGNVDEAIAYLNAFAPQSVKSAFWLGELTAYLDRKKPQIVCYALRKALGLRNSSNRVEKANDMLVGQRQKHNGMSWSHDGSGALAAINMVRLNNETDKWMRTKTLTFAFEMDKVA